MGPQGTGKLTAVQVVVKKQPLQVCHWADLPVKNTVVFPKEELRQNEAVTGDVSLSIRSRSINDSRQSEQGGCINPCNALGSNKYLNVPCGPTAPMKKEKKKEN